MNRVLKTAAGVAAAILLLDAACLAAEKLYQVRSKDVGWDSIDVTITELKRRPRVSDLRIPHYGDRSAVESRFAMCAFTDIAIQRDFAAWIVSDRPVKDDVVRVGFLKSTGEDAAKVLGKEFAGNGSLRADVAVINRMCGIQKASGSR